MNNWSFLQSGSIGIDRKDIKRYLPGVPYYRAFTRISVLKERDEFTDAGICRRAAKRDCVLDINKNNLRNIFYTHDRPLSGVFSMSR